MPGTGVLQLAGVHEDHRRPRVERGEHVILAVLPRYVPALLASSTTPSAFSTSSARTVSETDWSMCGMGTVAKNPNLSGCEATRLALVVDITG